MEDDDDSQSSPEQSPVRVRARSSASANGRVTVAAPAPTPPQQHATLTLALPIQQPRVVAGAPAGNSGGGGGGREDCWSEGATSALIDAWGERYVELSRGNLKQKHWQEVADVISSRDDYTKPAKTDAQCKNRIDTLKKRYKHEKARMTSSSSKSGATSKWIFFQRLDDLIGENSPHYHHQHKPDPPKPATVAAVPNHHSAAKIAVGIPVGQRSLHHQPPNRKNLQQCSQSVSSKAAVAAAAAAAPSPESSSESFPPEKAANGKRQRSDSPPPRSDRRKVEGGGRREGLRELTRAILGFGEVYERVEISKLQQAVEMEKQRMRFAKDLEVQRMEFFVKTQMELTQLKHHRWAAAAAVTDLNSNK